MILCLSESLVQVFNEKSAIFWLFSVTPVLIHILFASLSEKSVLFYVVCIFLSGRVFSAYGFCFLRCVIVQLQKTAFAAVASGVCLLLFNMLKVQKQNLWGHEII